MSASPPTGSSEQQVHGVRRGYRSGCKCQECRDAYNRYSKMLRYRTHKGTSGKVPATQTRNHIELLNASGMGSRQIAKEAGVVRSTVTKIRSGRVNTVYVSTARKILAVTPGNLAPSTKLPVIGVQRRLQGLVAIGYSQEVLAIEIGMDMRHLNALAHGRRGQVSHNLATRVNDVYERLAMKPGPSQRSVTIAGKHGWAPPLAWEDGTIDLPAAKPIHWLAQAS